MFISGYILKSFPPRLFHTLCRVYDISKREDGDDSSHCLK